MSEIKKGRKNFAQTGQRQIRKTKLRRWEMGYCPLALAE